MLLSRVSILVLCHFLSVGYAEAHKHNDGRPHQHHHHDHSSGQHTATDYLGTAKQSPARPRSARGASSKGAPRLKAKTTADGTGSRLQLMVDTDLETTSAALSEAEDGITTSFLKTRFHHGFELPAGSVQEQRAVPYSPGTSSR